jgi:hypothetical protein
MRGGMAQHLRVEALEAKQLGPSHQRPVQRVVGEPSAAIAVTSRGVV